MSVNDQTLRGARKRSRATHTKSRQGCYMCKSRRVKCDEAKPVCGACALRSEACGYPTYTTRQARTERHHGPAGMPALDGQRPSAFLHGSSPRALDFNLPSPSVPTAEVNSGSMNMVDLRLLSHFMIRTSKHMSLSLYRQQVWETAIPRLTTDHEFLMHLLLALAGLDDFPLVSQPAGGTITSDNLNATSLHYSQHMQIVVGHHQCGLQGFRDQLSTLSNANCNQVFAGSMLLVAFAFASLRVRNWSDSHMSISTSTSTTAPLPKLRLDWIYLIRGLSTVVEQCWPSLTMGPFREILQYPGATEDWKMYPDTMFTTVAAPAGCSPRIARFCRGAFEAISRLRCLQDATPSPMDADSPLNSGLDQPSSAFRDGLELLESMYMRILYVVQFSRDETNTGAAVALAIQADMENAAVMGWPQALSESFLASLGSPDVIPNASLVVLAHLYLSLALFEATWFLNGAFDEEIMKIDALFKASGDETFIALMQWPVTVLND